MIAAIIRRSPPQTRQRVTRELELMLELSGAADYSAALGSDARSVTVDAGAELVYALNRVLSLTASYEHIRYLAFSDSSDYEETQIGAGLKISR